MFYKVRLSSRRVLLLILLLGTFVTININTYRSNFIKNKVHYGKGNIPKCLQWEWIAHQNFKANNCLPYNHFISSVWTHDGSGIMKYIQWIATRKLGNIRISRLSDSCEVLQENYFFAEPKNDKFVQIYILPLTMNFLLESKCSSDLVQIMKDGMQNIKQIYFKRRSINATVFYQQLDQMRSKHNITLRWSISLSEIVEKANVITKYLIRLFTTKPNPRLIVIDSEDLLHAKFVDAAKALKNFISLLGLNTSTQRFKDALDHDSYHFTQDATWWDQSATIEHILSMAPDPSLDALDTSNDFYHLNGNHSFEKYVSDNRQCFNDGIFFQMQSETITNRTSTDKPERCSLKQFDCAFSDLYSFNDREQLYQSYLKTNYFNENPVKCGFAIQSILDKVRKRYGRNNTCQTIVFTCITNCYDPLPTIQDKIPPGTCFVALLDKKTMGAIRRPRFQHFGPVNLRVIWDYIDLGEAASLFRVPAKLTEVVKNLGHRMFPMAKWIVWLDGKAFIINIDSILSQARTPILGLFHHDLNRTSENEVNFTINRVILRESGNPIQLRTSLQEMELQKTAYTRDGFYARSNAIKLRMFDIAIFIYRNNHPCSFRYLCGWHNEVNYFSYRGQLSVYYSAERLNLTRHLGLVPRQFYHTLAHREIC